MVKKASVIEIDWKRSIRSHGEGPTNIFISKIYTIVGLQMVFAAAVTCFFIFEKNTNAWAKDNPYIVWIGLGITLGLVLFFGCFESLRRKFPTNLILLCTFTIIESLTLASMAAVLDLCIVLSSIVVTAIACFLMNVGWFKKKRVAVAVFIPLLVIIFIGYGFFLHYLTKFSSFTYFGILAFLFFNLYLALDSYFMTHGEYTYMITPEEVIFGAFNLHTDVIQLIRLYLVMIRVIPE